MKLFRRLQDLLLAVLGVVILKVRHILSGKGRTQNVRLKMGKKKRINNDLLPKGL